MAVAAPTYVTREMLKAFLDVKFTARNDPQVDLAIAASTRDVDKQMQRTFAPLTATRYFDWPNYQRTVPWRLWFDSWELADIPTTVTTGGVTIPLNQCFFEPVNAGPPYIYMELNRSTVAAFGAGSTPQHDIAITGTWGYALDSAPAGTLGAAVTNTTGTAITVSNAMAAGVGDLLLVDAERMLLADKAYISSGQTQQGTGCSTAASNDQILAVTDGTKYAIGEVVVLDAERMLILDIVGNNATVKRAWDGTALATHFAATIYAARQWTVVRAAAGTVAATHTNGTAITRHLPPPLITQLALAEAENHLLQGISGYARTVGSADNARPVSGQALADIRKITYQAYGRKARIRAV
jgi:hypothetical protein